MGYITYSLSISERSTINFLGYSASYVGHCSNQYLGMVLIVYNKHYLEVVYNDPYSRFWVKEIIYFCQVI